MERLILGISAVLFLFSSPISSSSNCICPEVWQPLCASNGITYSNLCEFQCVQTEQPGLTVVTEHACNPKLTLKNKESQKPQRKAFCSCTMDYNPVCGSDGKTYGNPCTFDCAKASNQNLLLSSYGECTATLQSAAALKANVPEDVKPVERVEPARCFCTREYNPVCGSNKITYSNKCEFRCAQDSIKGLTILSEGPCEEQT